MKLLFICSGNICRSPAAEAMARLWLDQHGHHSIETASCGTLGISGEPAARGTQRGMKKRGVDLSTFRSRGMSYFLLRESDMVLCLEQHHRDAAIDELGGDFDLVGKGIHVLTEFHPDSEMQNDAGIYDFLRAEPVEYEDGLVEVESCVHALLEGLSFTD